jgi:hypothetical protein
MKSLPKLMIEINLDKQKKTPDLEKFFIHLKE